MNEKHVKLLIISLTVVGVAFLLILTYLSLLGKIVFCSPFDFGILTILLIAGPYPFYEQKRLKLIGAKEERLSDFLRDVAESSKFGMTLAESIKKASKGDYGKLTPEIKKMAYQTDWGVPATEAFELFGKRVNTPLVNRATAIVIKASKAGGEISDVLTVTADNTKEIQLIGKERKTAMSSYKLVIYIAFFVFLATVFILNLVFIPAMEGMAGGKEGLPGGGGAGMVVEEVKNVYLGAALVQGFGDGLLIGVMERGKIVIGLRHSFLMVAIAFAALRFMMII